MKKVTVILTDGNEMVIDNVDTYFIEGDFLRLYHDGNITFVNENRIVHFTVVG